MNRVLSCLNRSARNRYGLAWALAVVVAAALWAGAAPAYALPEYASRTGEPCATCHVNPGGGGPRTMRGLLWGARGRPDLVPSLPGLLIAPGVDDPAEIYDIACAACHGHQAEGLYAMALVGTGVSEISIRSFILRGIPRTGMPAFEGQFTDPQLQALVTYVAGLSDGQVAPPQTVYRLPPSQLRCSPRLPSAACPNQRLPGVRGN